MEQTQALSEFWGMFRRRLPILAVVSVLGVCGAAFIAYILPPVYESSAKILVESQQIPTELARSTVTASAAERLQVIQQRLMTRDNLLNVIEDLGLFKGRDDLTISDRISLLRKATKIAPITLDTQSRRRARETVVSAFTIKVTYNNAEKAASIANEFVTTVLDQNLRARTERASETLAFFEQEEERLSSQLSAFEAQITGYKAENETALPESLEFRRSELSRLAQTDLDLDRDILRLEDEKASLEISIQQLGVAVPESAMTAEQRELERLNSLLTQKRATFSENHREVRLIKAQIRAMEEAITPSTPDEETLDVYALQKATMDRQIALITSQLTLLKDQKEAIEDRRRLLETSLQETPNIEMTLNGLYRRLNETQEQLALIVRKRVEAQTGERLELNQQAERFEVIENPLRAEKPVSPNRRKIVVMGSGLSIALALALAFVVEFMNPSIRTAAQMERQLNLRPVVSIPYIRTSRERRSRALMLWGITALVVAGVPALLYAIDQHYVPLELLGVKLAERTGLDELVRIIEARF